MVPAWHSPRRSSGYHTKITRASVRSFGRSSVAKTAFIDTLIGRDCATAACAISHPRFIGQKMPLPGRVSAIFAFISTIDCLSDIHHTVVMLRQITYGQSSRASAKLTSAIKHKEFNRQVAYSRAHYFSHREIIYLRPCHTMYHTLIIAGRHNARPWSSSSAPSAYIWRQ